MDQAVTYFQKIEWIKNLNNDNQIKNIYLINTTGLQRLQPRRTLGRGVKSFTISLCYTH